MKNVFIFAAALSFTPFIHAGITVEKTATGGAIVKADGALFAEYVVDQANKPYLWPIIGPTGKHMTRAWPMKDVEGEKKDHPHHRGLNFGHENIGGFNTWAEAASYGDAGKNPEKASKALASLGSIKHREFTKLEGGETGVIVAVSDYLDREGKKIISEERTMIFRAASGTRSIDFDVILIASEGEVVVDDRKDSGLSIRVPHSMCVDAKEGGKIVNSKGDLDGAAWSKRAEWCDFHGPVEGEHLGIAMLNHPASFRHPTPWHARTYGLFTANPFGTSALDKTAPNGAVTLKKGERISLYHRFIFHKGDEKSGGIADAFAAYAKEKK